LLCFSVIPVHMLHFVSHAASFLCHFVSHTCVACATHIVSCVVNPSVIQNYVMIHKFAIQKKPTLIGMSISSVVETHCAQVCNRYVN